MPAITPIATSRVSNILVRERLLSQLQYDQTKLFDLQTSLSTGRRISLPSQDAPAALRAIGLQRLLERKTQAQTNLSTNQSYLSATDTAVADVSSLLADLRAVALSAVDSASGPTAKRAAALEVDDAIKQMIDIGNHQFRGRYLFSGSSTTTQPYQGEGSFIKYAGNSSEILSYSDIDVLIPTNVSGDVIFGGISDAVHGTADLDPILTPSTRLSDLHQGLGIRAGSFAISDGSKTSIINIGQAASIGDVARLIEENPPAGRAVKVTIGSSGLSVEMDAAGGGTLTIREVGGGTTANELGILKETGSGTGPVVGGDLNPQLNPTTSLRDILGVRSKASVPAFGEKNELTFEASVRGAALNDVTISFVNGGPDTAGAETVLYDDTNPLDKKLIITIEEGTSTANQVLAAVNAEGTFTAALDLTELDNDGTGVLQSTATNPDATGLTAGGDGIEFDQSSGMRITNAGQEYTLSFASARTVEDLLNVINGSGASVLAEINANGTGIDVRSRLSGTDFSIGENGGSTASELGLRSFTTATRVSDLNQGHGISTASGTDFRIRRKDGVILDIDVSGAQTIGDILVAINGHPDNQVAGSKVTAQLATYGNGIELVTTDASVTATFAVLTGNLSGAAEGLGLVPVGQTQSAAATIAGGTETLTGRDVNPLEVKGVFTALTRLRDALRSDDLAGIQRAMTLLDESATTINFSRAELGARQQAVELMQTRLDKEEIELRGALSTEIEVDMLEVISALTARQTAMQASLQSAANISKLTLLDYL